MDRYMPLTLISTEYISDDLGQQIAKEKKTDVIAEVESVGGAEWNDAGRNGIRPAYRFKVDSLEYSGEEIVEYLGNRYGIYRTYLGDGEKIELYAERKAGYEKGIR